MRLEWILLIGLGSACWLGAADIKTPPWETPPLVIGRDLFRENCAVCHDIDKDQRHTRKLGPSLYHLFKNEKLPLSHGKPSRQYVAIRIRFGGTIMPAFAKRLSNSEIDTLMDYIASK
jgi:mono/diheme cytochrome c family protein